MHTPPASLGKLFIYVCDGSRFIELTRLVNLRFISLALILFYDKLFVLEISVPVAPFALKSMWIFAEQLFLKRHCSAKKVLNFAKIDPSLADVIIFSAVKYLQLVW